MREENRGTFSLPFFFGKTRQFSGFVGKDKSKTYKQEKWGKLLVPSKQIKSQPKETNYILAYFIFNVLLFMYYIPDTKRYLPPLGIQGTKDRWP